MQQLTARHWQALARMWQALGESPATLQPDLGTTLVEHLLDVVGGECGFLVVGRRGMAPVEGDPLSGWRIVWTEAVGATESQIEAAEAFRREFAYIEDPQIEAMMRVPGKRAFVVEQLVDPKVWARCGSRELMRVQDIDDRLVAALPVTPDVEVYVGLDRARGSRGFTELERDLMRGALEGLDRTGRDLVRGLGLLDQDKPLSPRERTIVAQLLTGRSEKQIAQHLRLTPRTTHQYVGAVYRKLGVRSRAELMSLWLNGEPLGE